MPLHDVLPGADRHQTRGQSDCRRFARIGKGDRGMSTSDRIPKQIEDVLVTHRRGFLKSAGLLAVSFGAYAGGWATEADAQSSSTAQRPGPYPDPDFRQIDSWIVIHENNTATFFVGKTDCGQGTGTSFRQMMSDELDI